MHLKILHLVVLSTGITLLFTKALARSLVEETARRLESRYNNAQNFCRNYSGEKRPAHECSGILMRGASNETDTGYVWDMNPFHIAKQAFSAAYLRRDAQWSRFPNSCDSGSIMYPPLHTPQGKTENTVCCAFPMDARTISRGDAYACGRSHHDVFGSSDWCHKQGISSFSDWVDHYHKWKGNCGRFSFAVNQCAFNMTSASAAELFQTVLQANTFLTEQTSFRYKNNEIMLRAWDHKNPKVLPIEAFFYLKGSSMGLQRALGYQADFKRATGEVVPVISIQLPSQEQPFKAIAYEAEMADSRLNSLIVHSIK